MSRWRSAIKLRRYVKWLPFWAFLAWYWRPPQIENTVINWGDTLEVIWGIEWVTNRISAGQPWTVYPNLYHPQGFHLGSFAHTPLFFLIATPMALLSGTYVTYHVLSLLPVIASYGAALRLFRSQHALTDVTCALVYTFAFIHTFRAGAHQNIMWLLALLPLLAHYSLQLGDEGLAVPNRPVIWAGVTWGVINNFSLYGVFLGALVVFCLSGVWRQPRRLMWPVFAVSIVTLMISLPTLLPYWLAVQTSNPVTTHISIIALTGNDPLCLIGPQPFHPLQPMAWLEQVLCSMPKVGGLLRYGFVTTCFAVLAGIRWRTERPVQHWLLLGILGSMLSWGPVLLFQSAIVEWPPLAGLNALLWNAGVTLKPELLGDGNRYGFLANGVPLPSYVLLIFLPFFEAARTMERYAFAGFLAVVSLSAVLLRRLPRWPMLLCAAVWLFVSLPPQPNWVTFGPEQLHPAYQWLAKQPGQLAFVDLRPSAGVPGYIPYQFGDVYPASYYTGRPSASRTGGNPPQHTAFLLNELVAHAPGPRTAMLLTAYDIGYLAVHYADDEHMLAFSDSAEFNVSGCFDGVPDSTWNRPICIATVNNPQFDVLPDYRWSVEPWGAWLTETSTSAEFAAWQAVPLQLSLEAFPFCVPEQQQQIRVKVNGTEIGKHQWDSDCATAALKFQVPQHLVKAGWNTLVIDSAYATSPQSLDAANPDPRTLSVGINRLRIEPVAAEN